jgi:hypothetical protein
MNILFKFKIMSSSHGYEQSPDKAPGGGGARTPSQRRGSELTYTNNNNGAIDIKQEIQARKDRNEANQLL